MTATLRANDSYCPSPSGEIVVAPPATERFTGVPAAAVAGTTRQARPTPNTSAAARSFPELISVLPASKASETKRGRLPPALADYMPQHDQDDSPALTGRCAPGLLQPLASAGLTVRSAPGRYVRVCQPTEESDCVASHLAVLNRTEPRVERAMSSLVFATGPLSR